MKPRPYGHYFILEKIAQGGMAEIFKGLTYDFSGLKKFIVIKRILPHIAVNKNFIKMLIDEAKIAVRLNHGNIAQTFDLGKVADDYFIVMEFVDGKTLSQIFKKSVELKQSIPIQLCAYVAREICNGLDYIHRAKDEIHRPLEIVHRDISPQNVILSEAGNVKIVDFGVAKAAFKLSEMERGVLKGKFAYMSPEQTEGNAIDARSDTFSLGVVLWETLTGRRLFKRKANADTIEAVQSMTVYPPSAYRNDIPSELDDIVMRALERNPQNRYDHASDMGLALTKFLLRFFPDFKPHQVSDYLQDLFEDEDNTTDLFQEKTIREELTVRETRESLSDLEDAPTMVEDTMIVDPQELDFHSVFEEIEVDDTSEVTRAVGSGEESHLQEVKPLTVDFPDFELDEDTGDIPLHEGGVPTFKHPSAPKINSTKRYLALIAVILLVALFGFYYSSSNPADLILKVNPPDAHLIFEGKPVSGSSPFLIRNLPPRRNFIFTLSREGFENYQGHISVMPAWDKTLVINLKASNQGLIKVDSNPEGAAIFVDGQGTGQKTPAVFKTHELKFPLTLGVSTGGAPIWQKRLENPPSGKMEIFADLTVRYGLIDVESSPSGAPVKINGLSIGKTPIYSFQIESGKKIELRIELNGFKSFEKTLDLKSGESQKIYQALQKSPK